MSPKSCRSELIAIWGTHNFIRKWLYSLRFAAKRVEFPTGSPSSVELCLTVETSEAVGVAYDILFLSCCSAIFKQSLLACLCVRKFNKS